MGLLARILGRAAGRDRGLLAKDDDDMEGETPRMRRPPPTPATRQPQRPLDTPTTRPLGDPGSTAGTPRYGAPAGTPSTQRIHNPTQPGR